MLWLYMFIGGIVLALLGLSALIMRFALNNQNKKPTRSTTLAPSLPANDTQSKIVSLSATPGQTVPAEKLIDLQLLKHNPIIQTFKQALKQRDWRTLESYLGVLMLILFFVFALVSLIF